MDMFCQTFVNILLFSVHLLSGSSASPSAGLQAGGAVLFLDSFSATLASTLLHPANAPLVHAGH
jgi:hypothetical protein